jgi:hypothetical protein
VSSNRYYRGRRLVIYDAGYKSEFTAEFDWWQKVNGSLEVQGKLPLKPERTDIIVGVSSPLDIHNVNLAASLLVHHQFRDFCGYWAELGARFENSLVKILQEHQLLGLIKPSWVVPVGEEMIPDNTSFLAALQELVSCAVNDSGRIITQQRKWKLLSFLQCTDENTKSAPGILQQTKEVFDTFRAEVTKSKRGETA